ncbi:MAG TPA: ATP-binding protein [Polyangiaceae bacterium]|nr:ATP-binding protein [Polyangiaceae bacterium]
MRLGVRAKLFLFSSGLIVVCVVAANIYLTHALAADLTARIRADLFVRLKFIERDASATSASLDDLQGWDALADDLGRKAEGRVTVIRKDGRVLGDSDLGGRALEQVENHSGRPEVIAAMAQGSGSSMRFSNTVKERMLYVATPFQRAGAIVGTVRLAQPLTTVDAAIDHLRGVVFLASGIALLIALLVTTFTSRWMSQTVRALTFAAQRMASGDLAARTHITGHDELAELGRSLDQLAGGLETAVGSLKTERDLMGRVLQSMQEGILLLDKEGHVALVNAALREMLLLDADVLGKAASTVIAHAELTRILQQADNASEPLSAEIELGELKPRRLLVHAAALPDETGGVLAAFVDVTDLRRLETLRRDFVANVSHELRTPVASVKSAAETLHRAIESQPEVARDFVAIIERNAERLHRLIEDLLDLSRIESREFRLKRECINLDEVAQHVVSLFQDRAIAKRMRLSIELPDHPKSVMADHRALDQVLSNLVDNAVKYGLQGGSVTIRAVAEGASLRISVEDTGPGIEEKHLARLFERFYRVDAGRSQDQGGTGLGLSIVKHLIEAMGSTIVVDSAVGEGTKFSFTLPSVDA